MITEPKVNKHRKAVVIGYDVTLCLAQSLCVIFVAACHIEGASSVTVVLCRQEISAENPTRYIFRTLLLSFSVRLIEKIKGRLIMLFNL